MQRPKTIAGAFLLAALIAGSSLGYAAGRYSAARESAPGERGAMRRYLAKRLDLDAAQVAAVDSILEGRHREMMRLVAPVQPQLDSVRAAARAQIMARLSPEQRNVFQKMLQQRDRADSSARKR
jgi:Spy/CpxP family protein refolding chaperone